MTNKATSKEAADVQAGPLGEASLQFTVPEGLLLDDEGGSITDAALAPTDIVTALVAFAAATIDLTANHTNFTLNNMIACLVATDILQVGKLPCCFFMGINGCSLALHNTIAWYPTSLVLARSLSHLTMSFSCRCTLCTCWVLLSIHSESLTTNAQHCFVKVLSIAISTCCLIDQTDAKCCNLQMLTAYSAASHCQQFLGYQFCPAFPSKHCHYAV